MDPYRDPTMEAAQLLEVMERECGVCANRVEKVFGRWVCKKGLAWGDDGCRKFDLDDVPAAARKSGGL